MGGCKFCGGDDVEYSEARGESYCTRCGAVLEENRMVESLTFTETSAGGVRAAGQFLPTTFGGGFAMSYGSRESREQALQRGYQNINKIASRLKLSLPLVEAAQRIYLMGIQRSFTSGRLCSHVAAACLYISCRREKSPQLLIDFSDVLCVPVKVLGAVFVKLLRVLRIHVPVIDPSLYMERFAVLMDLGAQEAGPVVQTGIRLVQAMGRDWIATGRRPSGLCGAALLISVRYHGIKMNAEDICHFIRMSHHTINKRISEWRHTATAKLTPEEFANTDLMALPILKGPPCYERALKRRRLMKQEQEEDTPRLTAHDARELFGAEEEGAEAPMRALPAAPLQLKAVNDELCNSEPTPDSISAIADQMLTAIQQKVGEDGGSGVPLSQQSTVANTQDQEDPLRDLLVDINNSRENIRSTGWEEGAKEGGGLAVVGGGGGGEEEGENLDDVSDTEVDWMILSEEEKAAKTLMWDELMKRVMPEVHRRWKEHKRKMKEMRGHVKRRRKTMNVFTAAASVRSSLCVNLDAAVSLQTQCVLLWKQTAHQWHADSMTMP